MSSFSIAASNVLMCADMEANVLSISAIFCIIARLFSSSSSFSIFILSSSSARRKLWSFSNSSWVCFSTD